MCGMVIGVTVFGYFMGAMGSMLSKMGTSQVCSLVDSAMSHACF